MYTFSASSKKCSKPTMLLWCRLRWILISDISFCLALLLVKVDLAIILAADTRFVSKFVNSKHFAKPPLPRNLPLRYYLRQISPLNLTTFSSMIDWPESPPAAESLGAEPGLFSIIIWIKSLVFWVTVKAQIWLLIFIKLKMPKFGYSLIKYFENMLI